LQFIQNHARQFMVDGNHVTLLEPTSLKNDAVQEAEELLNEAEHMSGEVKSSCSAAGSGLEEVPDLANKEGAVAAQADNSDNSAQNSQVDIGGGGDMTNGFQRLVFLTCITLINKQDNIQYYF
jgi:hypothetical protein